MDLREIALRRLRNQRLVGRSCRDAADAVRWLGAVQAQDFAGARWSVAMRCGHLAGADFDQAFDSGRVLRTHVLRPTWHLVPAEDLHWMQRLTGSRVHPANAYQCRKLGIDAATLRRSRAHLEKALAGGRFQTREKLAKTLAGKGINVEGLRLVCLLIDAELEAVICSGPRVGNQSTYALADERAPKRVDLRGDEALAELAWRYFRSHGPASAKDFGWWSGLTLSVARRAIEANASRLTRHDIDGTAHWQPDSPRPRRSSKPTAHLVSVFDEHLVAYRNHDYSLSPEARRAVSAGSLARRHAFAAERHPSRGAAARSLRREAGGARPACGAANFTFSHSLVSARCTPTSSPGFSRSIFAASIARRVRRTRGARRSSDTGGVRADITAATGKCAWSRP